MSDVPFYRTRMGQTFFDRTMPGLVDALKVIGSNLERLVNWLEREESPGMASPERSKDGEKA